MSAYATTPVPTTIDRVSGRQLVGGPVAPVRRVQRPAPQRPAPNFVARRLAALGVLIVALFVAAQVLVAGMSFFDASTAFAAGETQAVAEVATPTNAGPTHVAVAGDTLWSIAEAHRGTMSRDAYIDALVSLNGGTAIAVGQAVRLPTPA
ncbi:MAG: LysM peptidoglycan-binding domain-containing protein [Ilumatobacter sp.]